MLKGESWPLQRLVSVLQDTQSKEKDSWKAVSLSPPVNMKDISPEDRNEAVKWIAELNIQFDFHPETFFLATNILDRFITSVKAQRKYLKCIAISCFYLASKLIEEEDVIPCTGELVEDSACGCRCCDVLRMERIVLEKLSWDINSPTPVQYLHIFQALAFFHLTDLATFISAPHQLSLLTSDLTHAMCHYDVARFPSAAVALALLSIELEAVTGNASKWTLITGQLQALTKVETSDLMQCRAMLSDLLPSSTSYYQQYLPPEQMDHAKPDTVSTAPTYPKMIPGKGEASSHRPSDIFTSDPDLRSSVRSRTSLGSAVSEVEMDDSPPHPSVDYDSDKTMTASEGEDSDDGTDQGGFSKPRTYAEIVKWGLNVNVTDCHLKKPVAPSSPAILSNRCGSQASCKNVQQAFLPGRYAPSLQG